MKRWYETKLPLDVQIFLGSFIGIGIGLLIVALKQ